MASPSDQAKRIAEALRVKPNLLCHILMNLRGEKLAGEWEGGDLHQIRSNPWTGMPLCAVWKDTKLRKRTWRWAVREGDAESGIARSKEQAMAQVTAVLRGRGYTITDWTKNDD